MFRVGFFFLVAFSCITPVQISAATPAAIVQDSDSTSQKKADRYYEALRKKPKTGYLFERFYNASLDWSSVEQLEKKLADAVKQTSATNDRLLLAFFHSKQGDDVKALEQFREALKTDPGNADVWYEKAIVETRTLDFDTALADLGKAVEAKPRKELATKIGQLRGKLYVRNRQNDKAIEVWKKLIADNPSDDYLVEEVIELQLAEGLHEEAGKLTDDLIAKTKDPYRKVIRQLRKGDIVQRSGSRDKAIKIYESTLAQVGNGTWLEREILGQIENVFRREDDLVGLKDHYAGMLKNDGKRLALRKAAAKLFVELGLMEEAIGEFKKIIELTPGDRSNREVYIDVLVKAEKFDLAIKQSQSLIEQNPADPELQLKLARLYHETSKGESKEQAAKAIGEFVRISGNTEYAFLRGGRLFDQFKDVDNAAAMFQQCIKQFPESTTAKESWADHLYRNKKKQDAIAIWKSIAPQGCARGKLIRVARLLNSRRENEAAFEMLLERFEDFKRNPGYLGQLCTEAVALKKYDKALPWVMARVRYSKSVLDLNACVGQAVQVISKADKTKEITDSLLASNSRSVSETCLLSELVELEGEQSAVDLLMSDSFKALEAKPFKDAKQRQEATQMLAGQQVRIFVSRQDWAKAAEAAIQQIGMPGGRKSGNVQQLVRLLLRDRKLEPALKWVAEWKKISPGSLLPWLNESDILNRLGRTDESIRVLRKATRQFPEDTDLHMNLADRYQNKGQYNEAERIYWQQYEEAKNLSDKMRWTRELAQSAEEQGETEELVTRLNERKKNSPQSIEPILALAEVHRVADNYEERRKALLEATRIKKDSLPLLQEIARLEESEGNWENAIETLKRALSLDKTSRTKERMASIYIRYGEPDRGFDILLDIAGESQSDARELEKIASAVISQGEWEFARRFLQENLAKYPDDYRLTYLAAVADEQLEFTSNATEKFMELLDQSTEIVGLKKVANPYLSRMGEFESIMPPDTVELMFLSQLEGGVYSYQRQSRGGFGSNPFGGGGGGGAVLMPSSCEDCRRFALTHLIRIASSLEEEPRAAIQESVRVAGVGNTDLLFSSEVGLREIMQNPGEYLEENPNDETLLAMSAFAAMRQGGLEAKTAVRGYETFKGRYPELAFLFALQAAGGDKSHHDLLDAELKKADTFKPGAMTITMVAGYIGGQNNPFAGPGGFEHSLSEAQQQALSENIRKWYFGAPQSQLNPWLFQMISAAVQTGPSGEAWIEFLDQEVARSQTAKSSVPSPYSRYGGFGYGSRGGSLIKPIGFPPKELTSFPENVSSLLFPSENGGPFGGQFEGMDEEQWLEKIGPHISKAKNPILRSMLMMRKIQLEGADDLKVASVDLKKYLDGLLAAEKPDADAYLLAAGLAYEVADFEKSTGVLEKLRNLPLSKTMRQNVDSAMVAVATQGITDDLKSAENKNILASAKSAALRLRRARLSAEERTQLVIVFEGLGLNKEAEKMEKKLAAISGGGAGASLGSGFSRLLAGSAPASVDRIRKLVDTGKKDAAARLLINEFRTVAQSGLDLDRLGYDEYELSEFKEKIKSLDIEEKLLEKLDPGTSSSTLKLALHGYGLEVFGKTDDAVKAYAKVLDKDKKQLVVRLRLMLIEIGQDKDVTDRLAEFDVKAMPSVAGALARSIGSESIEMEAAFPALEAAVNRVTENSESKEDLSWGFSLLSPLSDGNIGIGDDVYLPQFYTASGQKVSESDLKEFPRKHRKRLQEFNQRRKKFHDETCRKFLKVRQLGPRAFTALLRSAEAGGQTIGNEYVEMAMNSILNYEPPKGSHGFPSPHTSYVYYGNNDELTPKRSPIEFLARHFGLKDASARETGVVSVREKLADKKDELKRFDAILALYTASEADFASVASEMIKQSKNRRSASQMAPISIEKIMEVWSDSKPNVDLDDFVLEQSKVPKSRQMLYQFGTPGQCLQLYLSKLAEDEQHEKIFTVLSRWSDQVVGTVDERKKLFADPKKIPIKKRLAVEYFRQSLQYAAQNSGLSMYVAKSWVESGLPTENMGLEYQISEQFESFKDADKFLRWLEGASDFLGDVDTFDPLVDSNGNSILGVVVERLSWSRLDVADGVNKKFKAKKKLTLGEQIIQRAVNSNNRRSSQGIAGLYDTLGDHLKAIKAAPESQQKKIAAFAIQISREESIKAKSKSAKLAKAHFEKLMESAVGDRVQELLAAKRLSDLGIENHELHQHVETILKQVGSDDPDQWIACFKKGQKLAKAAGNLGYRRPAIDQVVNIMNDRADYNWFRIVNKLLLSQSPKSDDKLWLNRRLRAEMSDFLEKELASVKLKGKKKKNMVPRLQRLYQKMGVGLEDVDPLAFVPVFEEFFSDAIPRKDYGKSLKWVQGLTKKGKYKSLANSLAISLRLAKTQDDYSRDRRKLKSGERLESRRVESLTNSQKSMIKLLDSEKLSLAVKVGIARTIMVCDSTLPADSFWKCTDVIADAYDNEIAIESADESWAFAQMNQLSEHSAFSEKAKTFTKGWAKKHLRQKRNSRGFSSYSYSSSDHNVDLICSVIRLFKKLDDESSVERVIAAKAQYVGNRKTIATLIESGYFSMARKISNQMWRQGDKLSLGSASFTKDVESNLPKFIEIFGNEQTKYLADVFVGALPDTKIKDQMPAVSQQERLATLAKRYASIKFESKFWNRLALLELAKCDNLPEEVVEALRQTMGELKPHNLWSENGSNDYSFNRDLFSAGLTLEMKLNNEGAVDKRLSELMATKPEDDDWSFRSMMRGVVAGLSKPLKAKLESGSPEDLRKLLPIMRKVGHPDFGSYGGQTPGVNLLAHISADRTKDYRDWIEVLKKEHEENSDDDDDDEDEEFGLGSDLDDLWPQVAKLVEKREELKSDEARIQLVRQVWELAALAGFDVGSGHFQSGIKESCRNCRKSKMGLDAIKKAKLLSSEEILEIGADLAKQQPVDGEIWRQLAHEHMAVQQFDKTAEYMKAAIDASAKDMKQAKVNRQVEYAYALSEIGENEKAKAALKDVEDGELLGANVARYADLKEKLGIE